MSGAALLDALVHFAPDAFARDAGFSGRHRCSADLARQLDADADAARGWDRLWSAWCRVESASGGTFETAPPVIGWDRVEGGAC